MAEVVRGLRFVLSVEGDAKTEAAVKKVDKAVEGAGQTAAKASTGGMDKLKGAFGNLSGMADKASAAFGKAVGTLGAIGAAAGAAVLVFQGVLSILDAVSKATNETARATGYLTEEQVKARTGLSDLTSGLDDYARSLGKVSGAQLTVLERMQAMGAIANGGSQNRAAAGAQFSRSFMRAEYLKKLQEVGLGGADLDNRIKAAEADAALQNRLQNQFVEKEAAKAEKAAAAPKGSGGRSRAVAQAAPSAPGGGFYSGAWDAFRGASRNYGNQQWADQSSAAIGSAVAAMPQVDAATQAIQQLRLAQDSAFDTAAMEQWAGIFTSTTEQFGKGMAASAANAILFGTSFTKGINQAMKALAAQAASEALFEGAAAVASLALGRPEAAALHAQAAALYAGVATVAALGAAASGGLRSGHQSGAAAGGRAPRSQDYGPRAGSSGPQKQEITVVIDAYTLGGQVASAIDRKTGSRVNAGLVTSRTARAA